MNVCRLSLVPALLAAVVLMAARPGVAAEDQKAKDQPKKADATKGEAKKAEPRKGDAAKRDRPRSGEQKSAPLPTDELPPLEAARDADYPLMGEFAGPVARSAAKYERIALQIRPTGNGLFEAIQYPGGLPGEPSQRGRPVTLLGKRAGDFLVLSGGPWAIFVEPDHCLLVDRKGRQVGRLERVTRESPTLGAPPPKDALVLFNGKGTQQFAKAQVTKDGLLMQGADIRPMFQDFNLHLEFMLPYMPAAKDQGRANSGVYLMSRYEVQVLDSFGLEPVFNGCASLYRTRKPDVNACLPPLVWQTYDIAFTAPRWASDGTKLKNARITIWHNGVRVQNNVELESKTGAGKTEEPTLLPTFLQNHGNQVRFRNIWLVDRGATPAREFPVFTKPVEDQKKAKKKKA